jgi:2-phosphoglycolate phosphatase, prokaryotic
MGVIKVIVFDLDGTLVDSVDDIAFAANAVLFARGLRPQPTDAYIPMIGEGARRLMERALAVAGDGSADDVDEALAAFLAIYAGNLTRATVAYPGVAETLAALAAAGFRQAVCTNKPEPHARTILSRLDLDEHFAVIVGGDSVPGVRKPDPRVLAPILEALQLPAAAAVLIGDSKTDVALARAAGMRVIVRAGGYATQPADELGADAVIDDFSELPPMIARMNAG